MRSIGLTNHLCVNFEPFAGFGLLVYLPKRSVGYEPFIAAVFFFAYVSIAPKSGIYGWKWNDETQRNERVVDVL